MKAGNELTIKEAKDLMRPELRKGTICLCCGQRTQMYHRHITSSMAHALIVMLQAPFEAMSSFGYIHIENYFKSVESLPSSVRGDAPKLRFWGLIQPMEGNKEDGNPSTGLYKITQLGLRFANNYVSVPRIAKIYNNKFYGFDDEHDRVTIKGVIKDKFDYKALMSG